MHENFDRDFVPAHTVTLEVRRADIDAYNHVNNAVYLNWLDIAAWSHSAALGLPLERCLELRRGMAALRTEIDYDRAALLGDEVSVGTAIVASDQRLRCTREFRLVRTGDGALLARAQTQYVCLNLDTGRATRMPPEFAKAYRESLA